MRQVEHPAGLPAREPPPVIEDVATIRVAKSTIILFSIIFLPLLIWGTSLIWNTAKIAEGAVIIAGYGLAVYWASSPAIELLPGRIVYRALFRRKEIPLSKVSKVSAVARPAPSLAFATADPEQPLTTFIIKPFSKNGIVALLRHVRHSSTSIRFDSVTEDLSKADFRSITRETTASRNLLRLAILAGATAFGASVIRTLLHG